MKTKIKRNRVKVLLLKYGEDSLRVVGLYFRADFFSLFSRVAYEVEENYRGKFHRTSG